MPREQVLFKDRRHAASLLKPQITAALERDDGFQESSAVVVGVLNGGVIIAQVIARALRCPLDILISMPMPAPHNPQFLIGVVSSGGTVVADKPSVDYFQVSGEYVETQTQKLFEKSRQVEDLLIEQAGIRTRSQLQGKWVIVVVDGVATGMTARVVLRTLRKRKVGRLILASPVMSFHAYRLLKEECDQLISLCLPYDFVDIRQFYGNFPYIDDSEVVSCLKRAAKRSKIPA